MRYAAYIAVMAVLLTVAAWCWWQNRRHPGPPSRLGQILDGQRVDSMLDVVADPASPDFALWTQEVSHPVTIYSCPDCDEDLVDEGFGLWCRFCLHAVTFPKAILDGGPDDEH